MSPKLDLYRMCFCMYVCMYVCIIFCNSLILSMLNRIFLYISLTLTYLCIYIFMYVCMCVCVCQVCMIAAASICLQLDGFFSAVSESQSGLAVDAPPNRAGLLIQRSIHTTYIHYIHTCIHLLKVIMQIKFIFLLLFNEIISGFQDTMML